MFTIHFIYYIQYLYLTRTTGGGELHRADDEDPGGGIQAQDNRRY